MYSVDVCMSFSVCDIELHIWCDGDLRSDPVHVARCGITASWALKVLHSALLAMHFLLVPWP